MPLYNVSVERTIIQTAVIEIEADDEEKAEAAARAAADRSIAGDPTDRIEWELESDTAEVIIVDEA